MSQELDQQDLEKLEEKKNIPLFVIISHPKSGQNSRPHEHFFPHSKGRRP